MQEHRTHTSKPQVVGPIGRCIYGEGHCRNHLSSEHVIPLGLGGGVILLDASCSDCRKITGGFESACLKSNFGMVRAHGGMPTRRPKDRPTQGKLFIIENGQERVKNVPLDEHPNVLAMPEFSVPPAHLTGSTRPPLIRMKMHSEQHEVHRLAQLQSDQAVMVGGSFNVDAFVRLLAKIAHGMMWISFDTERVRPLLLPIILAGETGDAWRLIGMGELPMIPFSPAYGRGVHQVICDVASTQEKGNFIIVKMRLFAEWGAPAYTVIAGEADHVPPMRPPTPPHVRRPRAQRAD